MFVELARGRSILVTEDGEPTDQFMLWQPALSDAEIDDDLARISRVDQAFEEHPHFPWVRAGFQADFHPKRSGAGACAFHLAMRNQGSQPPVSSRSSRDRLVVPASVLAQRLLLRASLRRRPRSPTGGDQCGWPA